jgi:hypothetical protein
MENEVPIRVVATERRVNSGAAFSPSSELPSTRNICDVS